MSEVINTYEENVQKCFLLDTFFYNIFRKLKDINKVTYLFLHLM